MRTKTMIEREEEIREHAMWDLVSFLFEDYSERCRTLDLWKLRSGTSEVSKELIRDAINALKKPPL